MDFRTRSHLIIYAARHAVLIPQRPTLQQAEKNTANGLQSKELQLKAMLSHAMTIGVGDGTTTPAATIHKAPIQGTQQNQLP